MHWTRRPTTGEAIDRVSPRKIVSISNHGERSGQHAKQNECGRFCFEERERRTVGRNDGFPVSEGVIKRRGNRNPKQGDKSAHSDKIYDAGFKADIPPRRATDKNQSFVSGCQKAPYIAPMQNKSNIVGPK